MSSLNATAEAFTPRPAVQPVASTSYLSPLSARAHPSPARRSPVPPKPGLCKFFNTQKGCSGKCRFVHGKSSQLPPVLWSSSSLLPVADAPSPACAAGPTRADPHTPPHARAHCRGSRISRTTQRWHPCSHQEGSNSRTRASESRPAPESSASLAAPTDRSADTDLQVLAKG